MSYEIDNYFANKEQILPLLHIISAIFIISSQVVLISLAKFFKVFVGKNYDELFRYLKRVATVFFILFVLVIITGFFLANSHDFKFSDPMIKSVLNTKLALSLVTLCNFCYVIYRFILAKRAYRESNLDEMKEHLIIAINYFVILDIFILLIAVYLGVVMAEFR